MKCPQMAKVVYDQGGDPSIRMSDCLKEECAWWHKGQKHCVIWGVKTALDTLAVLLAKLVDKMPPHVPKH